MKSQAFSMDIMLAIVIFIGTIFIFYSILGGSKETETGELKGEASAVLENIASEDSDLKIIDGVVLNETKIEELIGMEYPKIKSKLRVKNEFCFFLEDEDGNIIYIQNQPGVGSDKININDVPCG